MDKITLFHQNNFKHNPYPDLRTGWTVKISQKIKEGEKSRIQSFEGIIIARKHGDEAGGTITVRRVSGGFGVEKTFPLRLPTITKIEVTKKSNARKSKLYYLRDKTAKETRKKMRTEQFSQTENTKKVSA